MVGVACYGTEGDGDDEVLQNNDLHIFRKRKMLWIGIPVA
jgi:hypothetical protein